MSEMRSVSIDRAAELMGCSRRTVYYRIKDGKLDTVRTLGHSSQRVTIDSIVRVTFGKATRFDSVPPEGSRV